jgi:hypothetical protein
LFRLSGFMREGQDIPVTGFVLFLASIEVAAALMNDFQWVSSGAATARGSRRFTLDERDMPIQRYL